MKPKNFGKTFVWLILTLSFAVGMLLPYSLHVNALPGPRIYCNPPQYIFDTGNASLGMHFNVTFWIENVTTADPGLDGWQIELHYDDSIINVTSDANGIRAWPSATRNANKYDARYVFYNATGVGSSITIPSYKHVGVQDAYCLFGDVIFFGNPWKGTLGLLGIVEFQITAQPQKLQEFSCTLDITNVHTWIKQGGNTDTRATFTDSLYRFKWKAPPSPHMGLNLPTSDPDPNPLILQYGPYPPSALGQFFNAKFYIKNLYTGWYLTSASFNVTYNATVIDVMGGALNITIAPLWITFLVSYTPGKICVNVSNPSSNPGGNPANELVCTINFMVKKQQSVPPAPPGTLDKSDLLISNVKLIDHVGAIPAGTSETGLVKVYAMLNSSMPHDVAITNVGISKTVVCQGYSLFVNVTVKNQGFWIETINVTVKSDDTRIGNQTIVLASGNMTVLTFEWNTTGFAKGNYTINAYAQPVLNEIFTEDNNFTDGFAIVSMVGDICSEASGPFKGWPDGRCDMSDVYVVCVRFGVIYPNPKYNPNFDINSDGRIDMSDIYITCKNFGKIDP